MSEVISQESEPVENRISYFVSRPNLPRLLYKKPFCTTIDRRPQTAQALRIQCILYSGLPSAVCGPHLLIADEELEADEVDRAGQA